MPDAPLSAFLSQLTVSRELLREIQRHFAGSAEPIRSSRAAIASSLELLQRLETESAVAAMYGARHKPPET